MRCTASCAGVRGKMEPPGQTALCAFATGPCPGMGATPRRRSFWSEQMVELCARCAESMERICSAATWCAFAHLDSRFSGVMSDFISTYLFMGFLSSCGVLDGFGVSEGCWFVWLELYWVAFERGISLRGTGPWDRGCNEGGIIHLGQRHRNGFRRKAREPGRNPGVAPIRLKKSFTVMEYTCLRVSVQGLFLFSFLAKNRVK